MVNECVMYSCVFLSCLELVVFGVLFFFEWEPINKERILEKSTSVAAHVW